MKLSLGPNQMIELKKDSLKESKQPRQEDFR
jgi:hypothetical protein